MVRSEILEQCLTRIVTGAGSVDRAVSLLSKLVAEQPHAMLGHLQQIKDLFDYVSALPPSVATALLRAVGPLLGVRADLHDYVVLAFRKAVFSKDAGARSAAVRGFVELVQLAAARPDGGGGANLQMQVFGLFRRCLTQQYVVRECVYAGLAEVYAAVPAAQLAILDLLQGQLFKYYDDNDDDDAPPLDLERCLTPQPRASLKSAAPPPVIEEPLPALLYCLARIAATSIAQPPPAAHAAERPAAAAAAAAAAADGGGVCQQAQRVARDLETLVARITEQGIEGFELGPLGPDAAEEPAAEARRMLKRVVLKDVCEAAMELSVTVSTKGGATTYKCLYQCLLAIRVIANSIRASLIGFVWCCRFNGSQCGQGAGRRHVREH